MESRVKLKRTLKPHWIWAIALGSAIGWGCFVLPADWVGHAGPLGTILGLLIGGIVIMFVAVCYGVMMRKLPVSGGGFHVCILCIW